MHSAKDVYQSGSQSVSLAEDAQQVEEELDDVDIQEHCSQDVVVKSQLVPAASHYQLRINYQVKGVEGRKSNCDEDAEALALDEEKVQNY